MRQALVVAVGLALLDPGAAHHCAACAAGIEKSLMKVPGVQSASVSLENEEAVIIVSPGKAPEAELLEAVKKAGSYSAKVKAFKKED